MRGNCSTMQNAAQAYGNTAKVTENEREREAALLMKAAAQLQKVTDDQIRDVTETRRALGFNRKLWTIFVTSVTTAENPLPEDIKNNIASLGVFILGQTVEAMMKPTADALQPLISINRNIAAGLRGRA